MVERAYSYEEVVDIARSRRRAIQRLILELREASGTKGGSRRLAEAVKLGLVAAEAVDLLVEVEEWAVRVDAVRRLRVKM